MQGKFQKEKEIKVLSAIVKIIRKTSENIANAAISVATRDFLY